MRERSETSLRTREIDLAGRWQFELDPQDVGVTERWWSRPLTQQLHLPGSMQAQGYGDDVSLETPWVGLVRAADWHQDPKYAPYQGQGEVKFPFWLQPEKHYVGVAWYQRNVVIPEEWAGKRVLVFLERTHWGTRVWFDGNEVGASDSLSVPHVYELTHQALPGTYPLTIRIDNRMLVNVGENAHSVSDHTQTNWNGVVGKLSLVATDPVWLEDVQVHPDVTARSARVRIAIGNAAKAAGQVRLHLEAASYNSATVHVAQAQEVFIDLPETETQTEVVYELGPEAQLWDEFHPALYRLTIRLETDVAGRTYEDERTVTFGLREFSTDGTQFTINGRKTFLRGTLECAIFPHTGYPPTDVESWWRILRIVQAHGLNHIRFHSWCPPEAAFVAADECGIYYQVECAAWTWVGQGKPIDEWLYAEGERITRAYGNHPSFVLMAHGNEPYGERVPYLTKWVQYWQQRDPRRLHTTGAGWPVIPESDFHSTPEPRIQRWGEGLKSRINALPPATTADYSDWVARHDAPIVSHEIGQWCAYPNFQEIDKYTGFLKAKNFEVFRDSLSANHMGDQANDFLMASGKLQTLCYKEDIESALRTPGFGGFQLLDLHDFPGQGTALVGVLDAFWEPKGYVTPQEYSRFCSSTVPLARLPKRIFTASEEFTALLEVAHFGPEPLEDAVLIWRLLDDRGMAVRKGQLPPTTIPIGNGIILGEVRFPWTGLPTARRYRLDVYLEGYPGANDWDVWLFPDNVDEAVPSGVLVTERLDDAAKAHLSSGGSVLLLPDPNTIDSDVPIGFSSVFWNTVWTQDQAPHTLGILCDPEHPALKRFPTEYHTNWQWWELIHGAAAMVLNDFPPTLRPVVQPIDTWFRNHRLGLLLEVKVGRGKLMLSSMDLTSNLTQRPAARQLRYSLLHYMGSPAFDPKVEVELEVVEHLFKQRD